MGGRGEGVEALSSRLEPEERIHCSSHQIGVEGPDVKSDSGAVVPGRFGEGSRKVIMVAIGLGILWSRGGLVQDVKAKKNDSMKQMEKKR